MKKVLNTIKDVIVTLITIVAVCMMIFTIDSLVTFVVVVPHVFLYI